MLTIPLGRQTAAPLRLVVTATAGSVTLLGYRRRLEGADDRLRTVVLGSSRSRLLRAL